MKQCASDAYGEHSTTIVQHVSSIHSCHVCNQVCCQQVPAVPIKAELQKAQFGCDGLHIGTRVLMSDKKVLVAMHQISQAGPAAPDSEESSGQLLRYFGVGVKAHHLWVLQPCLGKLVQGGRHGGREQHSLQQAPEDFAHDLYD